MCAVLANPNVPFWPASQVCHFRSKFSYNPKMARFLISPTPSIIAIYFCNMTKKIPNMTHFDGFEF